MKKLCLLLFLVLSPFCFFAQINSEPAPFPFYHYDLEKDSEISAAKLNKEITEETRIKVSKDGHLESGGKRLRIFGTNLTDFPASYKLAELTAQSLANQGYNCIRFHHTDAEWSKCFIKRSSSGAMVLDKKRLDLFDYFFAELKKRGIYSNINFLTGRKMTSADGYKKEVNQLKENKGAHILGMWDEDALNKQKEWAQTLMLHYNPYTKTVYAEDPAVAIVEINNENGLLMAYLNGWMDEFPQDGYYISELEEQWNQWLNNRKLDFNKLQSLYNTVEPLSWNLLEGSSRWNLEKHEGAKAELKKTENEHVIKVNKKGNESWHVQYTCSGFSIDSSSLNSATSGLYTLTFKAKASKKAKMNISMMQAGSPWKNLGWSSDIDLSSKWEEFTFTLSGLKPEEKARINFGGMGLSEGITFSISDVKLYKGGKVTSIKEGKKSTAKSKSVHFPSRNEYKNLPEDYKNLILTFLYEKEEAYWKEMYKFVREDIGSSALIMGTAMGCSSTYLQSCFDIIDTHAYWNHPVFPGTGWNKADFYVKNRTLTKAGRDSTLTSLAQYRVYGKPFCVSEYDHPYPNQYNSEMYPMLASYASFQDWDCIFTFCSEALKDNSKNAKITGYFDQTYNPSKSCASPIASRIFRNFLVTPAKINYYLPVTKEQELKNLQKNNAWSIGSPSLYGMNKEFGKLNKIGLAINNNIPSSGINLATIDHLTPNKIKGFNDSKEMYIDEESGIYIVNNDNVSITIADKGAVIPDLPEKWTGAGRIQPLKNNSDFATFVAVKEDDKYLIFACSWTGNKGEKLRAYGSNPSSAAFDVNREETKLTTDASHGTGPAYALGIDGSVTVNGTLNRRWKQLWQVSLNGNRDKFEEAGTSNLFFFNSNTLWWILLP